MKKKKIDKKKRKKESSFQKAMKKKLRSEFTGLKFKNVGDGMTEISF
jgi:hypothetical protein